MKKTRMYSIFLSFFIVILAAAGCRAPVTYYKERRIAMGTFLEVISADEKAAPIVFAEFKRIESLLSKYDPGSEVSRLNRDGRINASSETFELLERACKFWKDSGGAFDITVGPLLDIWGFTEKRPVQPSEELLQKVMLLIGSDKIILNPDGNVIEFKVKGMKIDLGGIAKGYALDRALQKLKASGINSCLINAGGQIYCLGLGPRAKAWEVGIQDPRDRLQAHGKLLLCDRGVSTSGDYEQFFLKDKKRLSHIFDPRTGHPAQSGVVSVTVTTTDNTLADALSTAVFVLGREAGIRLAQKYPGTSARIITEKDMKSAHLLID